MDTALLAVLVAALAVIVNALISILLHFRRAAFEEDLAEKKFGYDMRLAERKLVLDQQSVTLKRAQDLAVEVLSDFYQLQRMMPAIRSPASWGNQGQSRPRQDGESEAVTQLRDAYYVVIERLDKNREVIARILSKQFPAMALLGIDAAQPFELLNGLISKLSTAASMLIMTAEQLPSPQSTKWKEIIWAHGTKDELQSELDDIVATIEAICSPILSAKDPLAEANAITAAPPV